MKNKSYFVMFFVILWMQNFICAQTISPKKAVKIFLSAHTPMWSANIDLQKNTFKMMLNNGTVIDQKIRVKYYQKTKNTIVIKSADSKLVIALKNKNCDCPHDIAENEESQWEVKMILNAETFIGCAYFE